MKPSAIKTTSTRFLLGLFFAALILFSFIRWDTSVWLSKHINQAALDAGYHISYDKVFISGFGIGFEQAQVKPSGQQATPFDSLDISLSFSSLFSGELAADIDVSWLGNPVSFTAAMSGGNIYLSHIDAMIDVSRVQDLNIPAQLSGLLVAQGQIAFNQQTGQPLSVNIDATWKQAKAGLAEPEFALGDYQMQLHSLEDAALPWQWTITGGSGVGLDGSGTIATLQAGAQQTDPKQWPITGDVAFNVDNSNPSLAMMVQSMLGSNQAKFRLSGTLGNPRTDIIR